MFSIILCVRNGMPYLPYAVESILAQTYSNYEVVVQDGASTDGTLDYLALFQGRPGWSIVSSPDTGIGQGFNRAVQRCQGEIVGSVDADNQLYPNALELAAGAIADAPDAAAVYGHCGMIDASGDFVQEWVPPYFDLLSLMDGTIVPPFASSFFSRRVCAEDLRFDETMSIVPDFDLWLRLSSRPIVKMTSSEPIVDVRIGKMSSTWTEQTYDRQCALKVEALRRFLDGDERKRVIEALFERSRGGLFLWGADSMGVIGAAEGAVQRYFSQAMNADIRSDRFRDVVSRIKARIQPLPPSFAARLWDEGLRLLRFTKFEEALVCFELLQRSDADIKGLSRLIEDAKQQTKQAQVEKRDQLLADTAARLQAQVVTAAGLQAQVDLRDKLLAEQHARSADEIEIRDRLLAEQQVERAAAVDERDKTIEGLRDKLVRVTRGWRKLLVGRPRL